MKLDKLQVEVVAQEVLKNVKVKLTKAESIKIKAIAKKLEVIKKKTAAIQLEQTRLYNEGHKLVNEVNREFKVQTYYGSNITEASLRISILNAKSPKLQDIKSKIVLKGILSEETDIDQFIKALALELSTK